MLIVFHLFASQLTDFGLSFVKGGAGSDSMMQTVCGTPIYMGWFYSLITWNLTVQTAFDVCHHHLDLSQFL